MSPKLPAVDVAGLCCAVQVRDPQEPGPCPRAKKRELAQKNEHEGAGNENESHIVETCFFKIRCISSQYRNVEILQDRAELRRTRGRRADEMLRGVPPKYGRSEAKEV